MKKIIVCGAGGFIGGHLVKRLKSEGHYVIGIDIKYPEFDASAADDFYQFDLRNLKPTELLFEGVDEVYQLAADMGGAEYVFTGENDANILHNSAQINLNVLEACKYHGVGKIFYSSSACVYASMDGVTEHDGCKEGSAYPANPDSDYGFEKLFSERLYQAYARNYGIAVRIARYHNIFGELGTWKGGREKAPAALCRKIAQVSDGGTIDVFGDGEQTRSFLHVDECVEGTRRLMDSDFEGPVNIGSNEMVTINELVELISSISAKKVYVNHIRGPEGVRGRNSDNTLIARKLGWQPSRPLREGLEKTYRWISQQVLTEPGS